MQVVPTGSLGIVTEGLAIHDRAASSGTTRSGTGALATDAFHFRVARLANAAAMTAGLPRISRLAGIAVAAAIVAVAAGADALAVTTFPAGTGATGATAAVIATHLARAVRSAGRRLGLVLAFALFTDLPLAATAF